MVKLIMGLKGSGKTKKLVELVKNAVEEEHGNVVCIEKDKNLTYDIPYTVRLIHAGDYSICTNQLLKGFLCGLHAGNYDITHVFIDNFYKLLDDTTDEGVTEVLGWAEDFSNRENVKFTISATVDPNNVGDGIKKYFLT
ncbi:MAG: hypothetical protein FWG32_00540 [Oscillospiraceae bacterium]|nr:hypothetical protein [Oscillospiraceae bacterium]